MRDAKAVKPFDLELIFALGIGLNPKTQGSPVCGLPTPWFTLSLLNQSFEWNDDLGDLAVLGQIEPEDSVAA